jgi:hypothetical protein
MAIIKKEKEKKKRLTFSLDTCFDYINFFNGFFCLGSIMMQYNLKSYATQLFFRYLCTPVKEHALVEVHDGLIVFNVITTIIHLKAINLAKRRKDSRSHPRTHSLLFRYKILVEK